ncbi:MAG: hypothetical protein EU544_04890 [Promethearchaeota archaeon]|nr:MAG: hypothetical protein EU544_04890 [Candidatus Lokiarchaeota archaeon]
MTIKNNGSLGTDLPMICEECKSDHILQTEQGYVCANCGLVLDTQRMEYHRPYDQIRIQHSPIHNTTIGSYTERNHNSRSGHLNRLEKIHRSQAQINDERAYMKAQLEIKKILGNLDLPKSFREPVFKKFKKIYSNTKKCLKFRAPRKILPAIIFYHCRENNVVVNGAQFLEVSMVDASEFRRARIHYLKHYNKYFARNRVKIIKGFISNIRDVYGLDYEFYLNALKIAQYFWASLSQTADNVIAGLVSSVALLCDYEKYNETVSITDVCNLVNIQPSTVNAQISKVVVDTLKIDGFESPVKSSDLVKLYLHKLEIVHTSDGETTTEERVIQLQSGNVDDWSNFTEELMKVCEVLHAQEQAIPSRKIAINVVKEKITQPEVHIFSFPIPRIRQSKVFVVKIAPKFKEIHHSYGAQKGPPWDIPLINPG